MTSISFPANLLMSLSLVMTKSLFLQKMIDLAGILLPAESTMRYEPCSMKHLLTILRSMLQLITEEVIWILTVIVKRNLL